MDLNPLFTGAQSFRPGGQGGGELKLFEQVGIELLHGWLVEPGTPEAEVLAKTEDYDNAAILVAEADHISKGQLVMDDSDIPQAGSSSGPVYSDEERQKIEDGMSCFVFYIPVIWAFMFIFRCLSRSNHCPTIPRQY
jgi:ubiquitin carboxyl-terminal hydrolase MINDY-1/2